jgi:hypothetical protein
VPNGSLWREFAPVPTYRLAWVPTTGVLYAMELSEPDEDKDPVEVLGVLWSRPQVEACLAGWSERCGGQRSLLWARDRIARWRPLVEEAQVTLAHPSLSGRRADGHPATDHLRRPTQRSGPVPGVLDQKGLS